MHRDRGSLARYLYFDLPGHIARRGTYIMAPLRGYNGLNLRDFRRIDTVFASSLPPSWTLSLRLLSRRLDFYTTPPFTIYPTLYTDTSSHVAPT